MSERLRTHGGLIVLMFAVLLEFFGGQPSPKHSLHRMQRLHAPTDETSQTACLCGLDQSEDQLRHFGRVRDKSKRNAAAMKRRRTNQEPVDARPMEVLDRIMDFSDWK